MNTAAVLDNASIPLTSRDLGPRLELYRAPHKALRLILCQLLVTMGQTSFGDEQEANAVSSAVGVVLTMCDRHIAHEDAHVRPALLERAPKAVTTLDDEHNEHGTQVAELRAMMVALREATSPEHRAAIGRTLYLHFSVFVAETLAHMAYEERVVQPLMDRHFTFAEQMGIHLAIVSSIPPPEMMEFFRAMIPASNREERVEILGGAQKGMPPHIFAGVLGELLPLLTAPDAKDLTTRLGVADQ